MLDEGEWSEDFGTFTITELDINRGDVSRGELRREPVHAASRPGRGRSSTTSTICRRRCAGAALARLSARADLTESVPASRDEGAGPDQPVPVSTVGRVSAARVDAWLAGIEARQGY